MDWCLFLLRPSAGLSQGLGEERSTASHCCFVLLRVLCQSRGLPCCPTPLLQRNPARETRVCVHSQVRCWKKKKEWKPVLKQLYHNQMWLETYTKGFQGMGWYSSWDSRVTMQLISNVSEVKYLKFHWVLSPHLLFSIHLLHFQLLYSFVWFTNAGWVENDRPCLLCLHVPYSILPPDWTKALCPSSNSLKFSVSRYNLHYV